MDIDISSFGKLKGILLRSKIVINIINIGLNMLKVKKLKLTQMTTK